MEIKRLSRKSYSESLKVTVEWISNARQLMNKNATALKLLKECAENICVSFKVF
jgi:hypothetical protein